MHEVNAQWRDAKAVSLSRLVVHLAVEKSLAKETNLERFCRVGSRMVLPDRHGDYRLWSAQWNAEACFWVPVREKGFSSSAMRAGEWLRGGSIGDGV